MDYRQFTPAAPLSDVVQCVWTLEGSASELCGKIQSVLPDGRPELILHFGDPFERLDDRGIGTRQPAVMFAGQLTKELVLRPGGRIAVVGLRLESHGATALLEQPQHELRGLTIGIHDVSMRLFHALTPLLDRSMSMEAAAQAVQARVASVIDPSHMDKTVQAAVSLIRRHRGTIAIETVASRVGVSRRHLERQFRSCVGISPKRLARIARFQHAVQLMERGSPATGAQTAAACGYADQAHFAREFHELCGRPPSAHLLRRAELTGLFIDGGG